MKTSKEIWCCFIVCLKGGGRYTDDLITSRFNNNTKIKAAEPWRSQDLCRLMRHGREFWGVWWFVMLPQQDPSYSDAPVTDNGRKTINTEGSVMMMMMMIMVNMCGTCVTKAPLRSHWCFISFFLTNRINVFTRSFKCVKARRGPTGLPSVGPCLSSSSLCVRSLLTAPSGDQSAAPGTEGDRKLYTGGYCFPA